MPPTLLARASQVCTLWCVLLLAPACAHAQQTILTNGLIRATFGARGLTAIADMSNSRTFQLRADGFVMVLRDANSPIKIDSHELAAPPVTRAPGNVTYRFRAPGYAITVTYALQPGWRFVTKQLEVSADAAAFHVVDVTPLRATLAEPPVSVFRPTSARPTLGTRDYGAALRFKDGHSLLLAAQNPFLVATMSGTEAALRYAPDMAWRREYGPFVADLAFIAPVRRTGHWLPARMTPEWNALGSLASDTASGMDEAEVASFTSMVRASMRYEPKAPINVFVGWTANDYQIDVGTPEGRSEYKRVLDQAAATGSQYVLYAPSNSAVSRREQSVDDWSWEHVLWLGLGQQIRRNEWDPRTSPMPPSVGEMLDYARSKQLGLLAYVYPVLPFTQNPEWLVPARANSPKQMATLGNRALQDWLIDELVAFHKRTGIAGYAFDHTFLTFDGTSRYAQWWGWRRVMETLRQRIPDIVIDGRQAYHLYGPWSWLAGSYPHPTFNDEQPESFTPYPDLHFSRVSANRERYTAYRYRNYEFTPSELVPGYMTHQTSRSDESDDMPFTKTADRGTVLSRFRARDWDYLGWRYSVLSSIAVAGWNNVIDLLPARDSAEYANFSASDRDWLRGWLAFAQTHKELLRRTRTILGQPALGKIDGTSAISGDRGFIFLFNPDAQRLTARVPLDASTGITRGTHFVLREVHPLEGRRVGKPEMGFFALGDTAFISLDGGSALVLELSAAPLPRAITGPMLFGVTGSATVQDGVLTVTGARGDPGTTLQMPVVLPSNAPVARATVNGVDVPVVRRVGSVVLTVRFAGSAFGPMHPVIAWDSSNVGGRVSGTLTVPRRVFDQLRARQASWPIPWTAEDYRTTWLAAERLLLFAPFSQPDHTWEARLFIDGRAVEFRKAYTAVRVVKSTFVGFYADISLLEPDRAYRIELQLPRLTAGQFRGLYVENVEQEYTDRVVPPAP